MTENTFDNLCRIGIAILFVASVATIICGCVYVSSMLLRGAIVGELPVNMGVK